MEPSQAILYYLQHLSVLTHRQSDQVLQEQLGIGTSQYRILQVLQANPAVQQKQIANLLGQTEASISRQVKLMQEKGLIVAKVNPENKREHLTQLLPKGERLLEVGTQVLLQYHQPSFENLSHKDQVILIKLLAQVHNSICVVDGIEGLMHVGAPTVE
jgi:DNA-binding MarR family transcriptional regulator